MRSLLPVLAKVMRNGGDRVVGRHSGASVPIASSWKRSNSGETAGCFLIHATALSYHLRASSGLPRRSDP